MDLTRFGMGLKRWLAFGILGFLLILLGITEILDNRFFSNLYKLYFFFLIGSGVFIVYISISEALKNFVKLLREGMFNVNLESREVNSMVMEKRLQTNGPKLVAIGGGTGLSTMLKGLKHYTSNLTAVVTVGDDGGGSGTLRNEMGILPPGDIRNCLVALANTDSALEELMQYRFADGSLKGQSFGNLFLAAMNGMSDSFEEAVSKMSDVLAITGKVFPVTLKDLRLSARLADGTIISGESNIGHGATSDNPIVRLSISPPDADAPQGVLDAIREAEAIVIGPGSLFTSLMPNLLIQNVAKAIRESTAIKIYIANIMTQPGETDGYSVIDHLEKILQDCDLGQIDYVIVNSKKLSDLDAIKNYQRTGSKEVNLNRGAVESLGIRVVEADVLKINRRQVRHDPEKLANVVMNIVLADQEFNKPMTALDYIAVRERKHKINQQTDLDHKPSGLDHKPSALDHKPSGLDH